MKLKISIILAIFLISTNIYSQEAQTVYKIPFASKGNEIELEVANDSELNLTDVAVTAIEKPEWIKLNSKQEIIAELNSNKKRKVVFSFDVDKEANVMEEQILKFQITGNNQVWNKEIAISVLPPTKFELNQNYPNPFNPSTTISYTIPTLETLHATSPQLTTVRLTIFDILGREVATLVNKEQQPGFYKVNWSAGNYASGMYIYQIIAKYKNGERKIARKKLMLMK